MVSWLHVFWDCDEAEECDRKVEGDWVGEGEEELGIRYTLQMPCHFPQCLVPTSTLTYELIIGLTH